MPSSKFLNSVDIAGNETVSGSEFVSANIYVGGNVYATNISVSGISNLGDVNATVLNATSAENFGNLNVGGNLNVTGNINTLGEILTLGSLSALSVSASYFYGDGSYLTGIGASDGAKLPLSGGVMTGPISFSYPYGPRIDSGKYDTGRGGLSGISLVCSIDYDFNWQAGWLTVFDQNRTTPMPLLLDSGAGTSLKIWSGGSIFYGGSGVQISHDGITFSDNSIQTTAFTGSATDATKLPLSGGTLSDGLTGTTGLFTESLSAPAVYGAFCGGLVSGATRIDGNVTIYGDLSSTGTQTFANTVFTTTSALSVINVGTGPALIVSQQGTGDIASFYDLDQNLEILHVGGQNSTYPNVGVKVSNPNKDFTVNGDISANGIIWDSTGNSNNWNSNYTTVRSNSALWGGSTGTFGQYVKVVGVDASTIQSCIDSCLSANSDQNYTVFVPPGLYKENLILKPSVALIGLGGTLNTLGSVISGYHSITLSESQAQNNRIVLQDILFQNNNETKSTLVVAGSSIGQVRANGCYFSIGLTTTTGNVLSTSNNKAVYLDNCRLEMTSPVNSGTHIIQGNGPIYLFNTDINGGGRCIDLPYSATTTRVCTISGYSLDHPIIMEDGYTTTGLSMGMKVVGTGINGTQSIISEIVSLTSFRVNTGTTNSSYALSSTLTFGQTPYAEIHNSTISTTNGADVVRVGNGLLVGNNVNFTNTNITGHGLYLSAGAVAGLAFSTFVISSSAAPYYAVNGQTGSYYVANGISYSSSALAAYNTSVNPFVSQFQYTGLVTSVSNGGTGSTTAAGALTNLGAVPTTRTVSAGTGLTGGGDLSTNRTLTVSYGSTSTTSCVGNDSRLSDARSISFTTVPALSTSTGTAGAVARDTNFLYVCVATNTWKRAALTAF